MKIADKKLAVKSRFSAQSSLSKRKFFRRQSIVSLPNLIESQINSYKWFLDEGLKEILKEGFLISSEDKNSVKTCDGFKLPL